MQARRYFARQAMTTIKNKNKNAKMKTKLKNENKNAG